MAVERVYRRSIMHWRRCALATALLGSVACSGSHETEVEGGAELPPVSVDETTPPPNLIELLSRTNPEPDVEEKGKDAECVEPAELCDGRKDTCRDDEPDEPELLAGGSFFGFIAEAAKETGQFFSSTVGGIIDGFGSKGIDLSTYNSVAGYRLRFECEESEGGSKDFVQRGFEFSPFGFHQCDLRANALSSRRIRFIVERESDGHRVWQNMVKVSPSVGKTLGTEKIGEGRSGTGIQVSLENGLTLHAAFFSTGWTKVGAAGNRNQGALYLTKAQNKWMEGMSDEWKKKPLREWVFPGAHDAGMYEFGLININNGVMTQSEDMRGQLDAGMRYFDLRIGYKWARESIGLNFTLSAVHGPVGGASFREILNQAVDFLMQNTGEVVVLRFSESGIADGTNYKAASTGQISAQVSAVLKERGAEYLSSKNMDLLKQPITALVGDKKPRMLLLFGADTIDSWNQADYQALKIGPNLVRTSRRCLGDPEDKTATWNSAVIQLQGTGTFKNTFGETLQGNKLVFDRSFYPWLSRGNATGCIYGPTFVINDFVDNALTDSVVRGMKAGTRKPREQFNDDDVDTAHLPDRISWKPGELAWSRQPVVQATKNGVLAFQEDGNVVLYQVARKEDGSVCKRRAAWSTDTRGTLFAFQLDGNLVLSSSSSSAATWASNTEAYRGRELVMQADGNLVVYGSGGAVLWTSNSFWGNGSLSCN